MCLLKSNNEVEITFKKKYVNKIFCCVEDLNLEKNYQIILRVLVPACADSLLVVN